MISPFPPQFFILLGIDIFLGGSILVVVFDKDFPAGLPYILDFGSLIGFAELLLVPGYLQSYPIEMQFYYSVAMSILAVLSIFGCSLYALLRHRPLVAGTITIAGTIPAILGLAYFASAWLNGENVPLPAFPVLPWPVVWAVFLVGSAILLVAMVTIIRTSRKT
jgi:hypothetical protein